MDALSSYMTAHQLGAALLSRLKESRIEQLNMSPKEMEALEGKLLLAVCALRSRRNAMSPVNRLPSEVLAIIFQYTQENIPDFRPAPRNFRMNDWLPVTHVCTYWRNTALASASLWSNIDFYRGISDDAACVFLDRSSDAPLKVYYAPHPNLESDPGGETAQKEMGILKKLTSHHRRFKEFHLLADSLIGDSIWDLFPLSCPSLESLTVSMNMSDDPVPLLPVLFSGPTPRLRKLCLRAFTSWGGNDFSNLTHISLYHQSASGRHTLPQFLEFLEGSPLLQELALIDAGPQLDTILTAPRRDRPLVDLRNLRVLEIGRWPAVNAIARFLSCFVLPSGLDMRIWGPDFFARDDDLSALFPPLSSQLDTLAAITQIQISYQSVEPPWQVIAVKGSRLHLHGAFQPHQFLATQTAYPLARLQELRVGNTLHDYSEPSAAEWRALLQRAPTLHTLVVYKADPHPVLAAFEPLAASDEAAGAVLCPALATLHVHSVGTISAFHVAHLAESRAARGHPVRALRITNEGLQGDEQPYLQRFVADVECVEVMDINLVITFPDMWPTDAFNWSA